MQKDSRFYTFLLSHTSKEKIYIRRLEVSKRLVHTSAASVILSVGLLSLGAFGLVQNDSTMVAALTGGTQNSEELAGDLKAVKPINERRQIDYSRPQALDQFALNSGGPSDFKIAATDSTGEENEIEKRLAQIEAKSSPEYLPTIWAHLGKINNEFGFRRNPFGGRSYEFHGGMDIDGDKGDLVVAPANGTIISSQWQGGYGKLVEIDHGNGLTTRFGHLSKLEVNEGDFVQRGQLIGLVGSTGRSTGPHLHYELRLDKKPINPRRFLPPEPRQLENKK